MAGVRDDRQRVFVPGTVSGRRSPAVLIMLLLAVLAAIALIWNMSRRPAHRAVAPMASQESVVEDVEPAAEVPAATAPEPAPGEAAAAAPMPAIDEPANGNQAEIARVISEGRPGLARCYQRALVRDATMVRGNVRVRLAVDPSGRVGAVNVSGPPAFRAMQPCLREAIGKWSFPTAAEPYAAEFALVFRGKQ